VKYPFEALISLMAGIEFADIVKDENGVNDLLLLRSQTLGLLSAFVIELSQSSINPNYALGMHSLPRGLTIRLRRMSRLNPDNENHQLGFLTWG
jgi:hypothetical protein